MIKYKNYYLHTIWHKHQLSFVVDVAQSVCIWPLWTHLEVNAMPRERLAHRAEQYNGIEKYTWWKIRDFPTTRSIASERVY